MTRTAISKRARFEVFKRDKFTCQYCGRAAPAIVLQVDHIQPCAKGGEGDILNLVTSCADCNAGKSDKELADDSALQKRKHQLDDLQERREQLDMMVEWQTSLIELDATAAAACCQLWARLVPPYSVTETGKAAMGKLVRTYGMSEVCECMRLSVNQYVVRMPDGVIIRESIEKAFDYIGRIARNRKRIQERPYLEDLYRIRSIAKSKCYHFNDWEAFALLERAHLAGHDTNRLRGIALRARNWSGWCAEMEDLLRADGDTS
jgi:hypothetical protein